MRNKWVFKNFVFLFSLILFPTFMFCIIQGSKHDFSSTGWANGEICIVCHTPHNADPYGDNIIDAPLWNHDADMSTVYTLYSSPTLDSTPEQPRGMSKLCLSCHDGIIALDSFGGNVGTNNMTGDALIDTDLTDDHPISIYWSHQVEFKTGSSTCINCHNPSPTDFNPILPFFDRYLECATCHDVHNTEGYDHLLRLPTTGSQLCFHCHGK
jgi:predicted CXXCH cytochrome family protein